MLLQRHDFSLEIANAISVVSQKSICLFLLELIVIQTLIQSLPQPECCKTKTVQTQKNPSDPKRVTTVGHGWSRDSSWPASGCLRMVLAKFDMFLVFEPYVRSSSRSSSPTGSWLSTYNIPTSRVNTTKRFFERGLVPTSLMLKFDSKTSPSRAAFVWTHKIFPDRWRTLPHHCGATSWRADELPV